MGCSTNRYRLGDLCEFYRGASVPRTRMHGSGDYLYLHYGDLYKGFSYRIDVEHPQKPIPHILDSEKIKDEQRLLDQDIVYVLTSETVDDLGHSFLFNNPQHVPAVAGTETTIVRVKDHCVLLPAYLNYLMHSPRFLKILRQYVRGMKVFRVHPNDVARIEIELPGIETQGKVVSMLDAIHEKLLVDACTNGYLAALATTIYRQFLERASLNGHEGVLSELLEIKYGKDHKKLIDGNIPVYGSGGLMRRVDSSLYKGESVLIPRKGSLNNVMYVNEEFWTVDTMFYAVPKVQGAAKYCYEFLAAKNLASMNSGSAVPSMTTRMLDALPILVPNKTDLALFDGKVSPLFSTQQILSKENNALGSLRDTLLPKLMSGEIDVSEFEVPTQPNSHLSGR